MCYDNHEKEGDKLQIRVFKHISEPVDSINLSSQNAHFYHDEGRGFLFGFSRGCR